jgi:hypothetical protein
VAGRLSSARRLTRTPNTGWRGLFTGLRLLGGHVLHLLRNDYTAVLLIVANVVPIVALVRTGEPVGAILIIYWMQLVIIGFWNVIKLIVVTRLRALVFVPMFVITYMAIISVFGFIAGGLLDDQMQGTVWQKNFSPWNYWVPAMMFFVTHGLSFFRNFIGRREYHNTDWEKQISQPFLRAFPMWAAAFVGGIFGSFFTHAAFAAAFVVPVKIALDLLGHFAEHGMLATPDDPEQPS